MRKLALLTVLSLIVLNLSTSVVFSMQESEQLVSATSVQEHAELKSGYMPVMMEFVIEAPKEEVTVAIAYPEEELVLVEEEYSPINAQAPPFCFA